VRYARFVVPVAVAGVLLSGCGPTSTTTSSSPSPAKSPALSAKELVEKSAEALTKAGSYRMKGDIVETGDKISIDLKTQGSESVAVISMADQGIITVLNVGGASYFQADETFWKKTAGIEANIYNSTLKGKWVKAKAGDASMDKFTELTDAKKLLDSAGTVSFTVGEKTTINGKPALTLKDPSAPDKAFYVAAEGEPYPLQVDMGADGKLEFSDFGAKFDDIKAPPADKVISL
jgi:hypothetical protein